MQNHNSKHDISYHLKCYIMQMKYHKSKTGNQSNKENVCQH